MACAAFTASAWYNPTEVTHAFNNGHGTKTSPYLITNEQELVNFIYICKHSKASETKDKYYVLYRDIVLNDIPSKEDLSNPAHQMLAINVDDGVFSGHFDGRGHTITGAIFDPEYHSTFFGRVKDATISNVTFDYVGLIIPSTSMGSHGPKRVVAFDVENTTFSNVHVKNARCFNCVSATEWSIPSLTGFVDSADDTVFNDCTVDLDIDSGVRLFYVAGFTIGTEDTVYFNRCRVSGTWYIKLQSKSEAGIGGFVYWNDEELYINQCVCAAKINYIDNNTTYGWGKFGGFVAYHHEHSDLLYINESAFIGELNFNLSGTASLGTAYIGGFVGLATEDNLKITNCAFISNSSFVNSSCSYWHGIAGLVGGTDSDTEITNCVIASNIFSETISDDTFRPIRSIGKASRFTCSNTYYHLTVNGTLSASNELNGVYYASDLLTNDNYITKLNNGSLRTIWGRYNNPGSKLDGAPLPLACGGNSTAYKGAGTEEDPYLIETEADLRALAYESFSNTLVGKYYKQTADIVMSNEPFYAIGRNSDYPFLGNYNGYGHSITGMVAANGSMFAYMCGSVEGLALLDFSAAEGCTDVAPIAMSVGGNVPGSTDYYIGTVTNCYACGDLWAFAKTTYSDFKSQSECAGICGAVYDGSSLTNSYFVGSLNTYITDDSNDPIV